MAEDATPDAEAVLCELATLAREVAYGDKPASELVTLLHRYGL